MYPAVYVTMYTRTLSLCHVLCYPVGSRRHFDDQFPGVCFLGNALFQEILCSRRRSISLHRDLMSL